MGADANSETNLVYRRNVTITTLSESLTNNNDDDNNNNNNDLLIKKDIDSEEVTCEKSVKIINNYDLDKIVNSSLTHEEKLTKLRDVGGKIPIVSSQLIGTDFNFKREIVWKNVFGFALLHLAGLIGVFLSIYADIRTTIYALWLIYASGQGVTMGAHRLWSHRAFKAKLWLKVFLLWLHTLAGQNCLWVWVRDHRQHHKFSDTDADPHNANRGFFFSHIGWLLSRKHPKVIEYGKKIDMSDLEADPWIMFQKDNYKVLYTIFALILPTIIPIIFWYENPIIALFVAFFARTVLNLNATWLVNSAAHLYGTRPYDNTMFPVESMFVAFLAVGEGWHNYHHAFPWDYRASELGTPLNLTTTFIDFLAKYGIIFDRKEATHNMVKNRVMRTGDKSHHTYGIPEARAAVKTWRNIFMHPINPTYNSIYQPKPKYLSSDGYALIVDELKVHEKDEAILSKENNEMMMKMFKDEHHPENLLSKYIVDKKEAQRLYENQTNNSADENCNIKADNCDKKMIDMLANNNNNNNSSNNNGNNIPAQLMVNSQ